MIRRVRVAPAAASAALAVMLTLLALHITAPPPKPVSATPPVPLYAPAPRLVAGDWQHHVVWFVPPPEPTAAPATLDRIARAVEGAESSFGRDPRMWRSDPNLPQGPMQITPAAALDVGGGDRFDPPVNRALGRAYLAQMYRRYGDWRDTVLAYNWGPGNVDRWLAAGRPTDWLSSGVLRYVGRVLNDDGDPADDPATLAAAGPPPPVAPASFAPALPETPVALIGNPRLRREVAVNDQTIGELSAFLDASAPQRPLDAGYVAETAAWLRSVGVDPVLLAKQDPASRERLRQAGALLVFAIARDFARRPGFADFALVKAAEPPADLDAMRLIASVMAQKLSEANAAAALVDAHAHQRDIPQSLARVPKRRLSSG
jgi:hypothetical protein